MLSAKAEKFLYKNQPIFGKWSLLSIIGEGSSGTVYEIADSSGNKKALKVIPVSFEDLYFLSSEYDTTNPNSSQVYLNDMTSEIMAEIKVMDALKNKAGIMGYEEYEILEEPDEDSPLRLILIRMSLMTPLNKILRLQDNEFSKEQTLQLGLDLLSALIECKKQHIVHRDIKPANVFVTQEGRYVLGDFGSAKLLEHTMMASHKGTLAYMAPEITAGKSFNSTVDIYSLGILMYQLLNKHKLPFLDDNFKFADIEIATEKRLNGTPLPPPSEADETLRTIILKMCAFSPQDRYATALECKAALEAYIVSSENGTQHLENIADNTTRNKRRFSWKKCVFGTVLCAVFVSTTTFFALQYKNKKDWENQPLAAIESDNLESSGMIASDGTWLYTSQNVRNERGYKISTKTGEKKILCDYIMQDINLTEDYVIFYSYYTPDTTQTDRSSISLLTGLYRMGHNGEDLTCLDSDVVWNCVVYDNYVYYFKKKDEKEYLCRLPIEGGNCETLETFNADDRTTFYPHRGYVYVYNSTAEKLIRILPDGSEKKVVLNHSLSNFYIKNDKLYFQLSDRKASNIIYICDLNESTDIPININGDSNTSIHTPFGKLKLDFTKKNVKTLTAPFEIWDMVIHEDTIYFCTTNFCDNVEDENDPGIWSIKEDGSHAKQLYNANSIYSIQIVDEKIYFYDMDKSKVFCMDLDGSNLTEMPDISSFFMTG